MNLRKKTLFTIGIIYVFILIILYFLTNSILLKKFDELELKNCYKDFVGVINVLNEKLTHINLISGDWAYWDEAYKFIDDRNQEFIKANFTKEVFNNLKINFIAYLDLNGKVIVGYLYDFQSQQFYKAPESFLKFILKNKLLIEHKTPESSISGIIMIDKKPMLIASHPVITSELKGPVKGTLMFGRYIDSDEIKNIFLITHFPISIEYLDKDTTNLRIKKILPQSSNNQNNLSSEILFANTKNKIFLKPINNDLIEAYSILKDIEQNERLLLKVDMNREIHRNGLLTIKYFFLLLVIFGIFFAILTIFLINKFILSRVCDLTKNIINIREKGDTTLRLLDAGNDEITILSKELNNMLESLYNAEKIIKDRELRFKIIFDSIQTGVVLIEAETHKIMDANPVAVKMINTTRDNIIGQICHKFICPAELGKCPVTSLNIEIENSERILLTAQDERIPIVKTVVRVKLDGKNYLLESFVDISKQKMAEFQMEKAKLVAESANRAKSEFLANMSHEIRTPMNAIIGFTDILKQMETDKEKIELLDIIKNSSKHLLSIINDILDFSKIEAGKLDINYTTFNIRDMLKLIYNMFFLKAVEKKIFLNMDISENFPVYVSGDEVRLKQIVVNIIGNAIKFTKQGSVLIKCSYDNSIAQFEIKDTGIGIPSNKLDLIFEPFIQADGSILKEYSGTGLGLAICKKLIVMMKGDITVKSELGQGSTFIISLPLLEIKQPENTSVEFQLPSSQNISFKKVGIIEDNIESIKILSNLLEKNNFVPVIIEPIKNIVESVIKSGVSIILLDLIMPELNGYQINQILKSDKRTANIPIIACSFIDDIEKVINYGMFDFISKPIEESALIAGIERALKINGYLKNIFIIDDDENILNMFKNMLKKENYNLFLFDNASEPLEKIKNKIEPDLIILDIMMPVMNGFDFIRILRKEFDKINIPIIIVTAKDLTKEEFKELNDKCIKIFSKLEVTDNLINFLKKFFSRAESVKKGNEKNEDIVLKWHKNFNPKNDADFREVFFEGLQSLLIQFDDFNNAIETKDLATIDRISHSMKGAFGTMKAQELYVLLQQINTESRKDEVDWNLINAQYEEIKSIVKRIPKKYFQPPAADKGRKQLAKDNNVLIVEDNPTNQKLIITLLKRLNLNFDVADNGKIALEKLEKNKYNLVLLDMQMPVMDGFETIKQIRANEKFKDLIVVALTALTMTGDEEKIRAAGCNNYISKPIDIENVMNIIKEYFE